MLEFAFAVVAIVSAASVLGLAYSIDTQAVVIDPISVPDSMAESGITPDVVSDMLADEMNRIRLITESLSDGRDVGLGDRQAVIGALGKQLDVAGSVWMARELLGLRQYTIRGQVMEWEEGLRFRIRGFPPGDEKQVAVVGGRLDELDDLVRRAAIEIFRFVDPLVLGTYYYQREESSGDFTETMGAIQSGLTLNPADIHQVQKLKGIYNLWGRVLLAQGDYEQAIGKVRRAIALDPRYGPAYQTWGEVLFVQARYREVIEMCQRAAEYDPNAALTYRMWGDALYFLGYVTEAQEAYDISARLGPTTALAYFARGDLYFRLGQFEAALREYERGFAFDPGNEKHLYHLEQTRIRLGPYYGECPCP